MPELPEVETTRRGLIPHLQQQQIIAVRVIESRLRRPVTPDLPQWLCGCTIETLERRGKYLLFRCQRDHVPVGVLLVHLGMSGSLRVADSLQPLRKHDHIIFIFTDQQLRYHDPRRFGLVEWAPQGASIAPITTLGFEPLSAAFSGKMLHRDTRQRRCAIKPWIMNPRVVVGVGNIYASEALFRAGIDPRRQVQRISLVRYEKLALAIRTVLQEAIDQGGTSLRDFVNPQAEPGYFASALRVYQRAGQPCVQCNTLIRRVIIAQRSSFFCPQCQR